MNLIPRTSRAASGLGGGGKGGAEGLEHVLVLDPSEGELQPREQPFLPRCRPCELHDNLGRAAAAYLFHRRAHALGVAREPRRHARVVVGGGAGRAGPALGVRLVPPLDERDGLPLGHLGVHSDDVARDALLLQAAAEALAEEGPCLLPRHHAPHHALGEHALGRVVHVGELGGHLVVHAREEALALRHLAAAGLLLGGAVGEAGGLGLGKVPAEAAHDGVAAQHGLLEVPGAVLDTHDALGLQDAPARSGVRVHLNLALVDLSVNHHPGAAAQLPPGRDVHEHRLAVHAEVLHDS
mmetsp:Transcript_41584/g.132833  ORF Transcript_41584/g.132833 Transcript_41584/m.132833 type:complete len:296 (+) Transcript_41584:198-1085(+)